MQVLITDINEQVLASIIDSVSKKVGAKVIKEILRREINLGYSDYLYDVVLEGEIILSIFKYIDEDCVSIRVLVDREIHTIAIVNTRDFREIKIL